MYFSKLFLIQADHEISWSRLILKAENKLDISTKKTGELDLNQL